MFVQSEIQTNSHTVPVCLHFAAFDKNFGFRQVLPSSVFMKVNTPSATA